MNTTGNSMNPQLSDNPELARLVEAQKNAVLMQRARNGISWFYWIAGLSLVNSLVILFGASITFVIGLGTTQFIDVFAQALGNEFGGNGPLIMQGVGLGMDVAIAGLFAMLGFLGIKGRRWAVVLGMVLYGFDALLVLVAQSWFSLAFHAWALWSIGNGLKSLNLLKTIEKQNALPALPVVIDTESTLLNKSRILEIAAIVVIVPLVCLFLAVLVFFGYSILVQ